MPGGQVDAKSRDIRTHGLTSMATIAQMNVTQATSATETSNELQQPDYCPHIGCTCLRASHAETRATPGSPDDAHSDAESLSLLVEAISATDNTAVRSALLKGMLAGLEGRRNVPAPAGWTELSEELAE